MLPNCANINFLLKQPLAGESKFAQSWNINYTVLSGRKGEALIFTQAIKMSPGLDGKTELLAMLKKGSNSNHLVNTDAEEVGSSIVAAIFDPRFPSLHHVCSA